MVVEIIRDKSIWDKFVDESKYGLIFHKWEFLKIVERYSGCTLHTCGVFRGETLIGVFPLFYRKKMGLSLLYSPPPVSGIPYLGFVVSSEYDDLKQDKKESNLKQIADEVDDYIGALSPSYITLFTVSNFLDVRPFKWNDYEAVPRYNYIINLDEDLNNIWGGFKKNLRKQLSGPEVDKLKLVKGHEMAPFFNLLTTRYDEQGLSSPVYSVEYLEELFSAYPEHLHLYYLYRVDELVGAITTQEYKRYLLWMGNTRSHDGIPGNEYIIWNLIKKAKEEGYLKFEITGANTEHLCQFKSKFNPELEINYNLVRRNARAKLAERFYGTFVGTAGKK